MAHVGRRSAAIDAVLRSMGVRQGGFVTAWNPYSRRVPEGRNRRMQARLAEVIRLLPAAGGHGSGPGWREHHFLVGADPRRLAFLARRFRQCAIVVVRVDGRARLVVLGCFTVDLIHL